MRCIGCLLALVAMLMFAVAGNLPDDRPVLRYVLIFTLAAVAMLAEHLIHRDGIAVGRWKARREELERRIAMGE